MSTSVLNVNRFEPRIDSEAVEDLLRRLAAARWPDEPGDVGWRFGASLSYIRELAAYWHDDFDWEQYQELLGRFASYRTVIDGLGVHFIHERGRGTQPMPIVLTHGWPSSFLEMNELIPMLTDPERYGASPLDSFDVVVPSLPGYGFSDRPVGLGPVRAKIPHLWSSLMGVLGYERFGAHGGDIGSGVTSQLARWFPERLFGIHVLAVTQPHVGPQSAPLSEAEQRFVAREAEWHKEEGAYWQQQATRPQTLAFGLNDSPVGLAAWIVEKFRAWGDCHGNIESRFSKDRLLANISLYWFTQTIASSFRLYSDSRYNPTPLAPGEKILVPTGITLTNELVERAPRSWAERSYADIRHWNELDRGGHFLAAEEPSILAQELREFFRPLRVKGG